MINEVSTLETEIIEFQYKLADDVIKCNRVSERSRLLKRTTDILGALIGFLLLILVTPYIAYRIRKESPGAILFKQERTGLNGETFTCYKFRTMHINDDRPVNGKPVVAETDDPRIFAFGHFLRKSYIDELPQMINILRGDMSLVGPRPYPTAECRYWANEISNWNMRYLVKPGLSGFAQASGNHGGTLDKEVMKDRLKQDFNYIENASLILDVRLILKTVNLMFTK